MITSEDSVMAPGRNSPAVHSLDGFAFAVPDLDEAERFYAAFGLEVQRNGARLDLFTCGHSHHWGTIMELPGRRKKLQFLAFGCYESDFEAIRTHLVRRGYAEVAPHPLGRPGGMWISHPDGFPVQVVPADKSSPESKSAPATTTPLPDGTRAAPNRCDVAPVRPRRLSHVLVFTSDVPRAIRFYEDALGLRLSDQSGDTIAFMHGVHGSDHHLVATARSSGPGLHHMSWDVAGIDEVGTGMEQMLQAGYPEGWGVGRHVLGSNYFYYARDPWGSYCEYSFDIDFVPKGCTWPSRDHALEDSLHVWGPPVPKEFVTNFEI